MAKNTKTQLVALLSILVLGCTPFQTDNKLDQSILGITSNLSKSNNFQVMGKLGFKSPYKAGSATINWLQESNQYTISISGPFGSNRTIIEGNDLHATVQSQGEKQSGSPEEFPLQIIGISLPVKLMRFWIMGIPSPNYAFSEGTVSKIPGTYNSFYQEDWYLNFSRYNLIKGNYLPSKIKGSKKEYSFTLVIKDWRDISPKKDEEIQDDL